MSGLRHCLLLVRLLVEDRQRLALENIALRHQLAVLKRSVTRPKIQDSDRMFWILMKRMRGLSAANDEGSTACLEFHDVGERVVRRQ